MTARPSWHGVQSVLVTPFCADGAVDLLRFEALVEANIADGASAVIACGSTGEFYAMTVAERTALYRAAVRTAAGRVPVIAGVADLQTDLVLELCRAAEASGCDGLMALPPIYAMPGEAEIEHHYGLIAAASGLPLMLYNSPRRIGVGMSHGLVARLAERLPTVCAIKDSSGDILHLMELVRATRGRLSVLVGYETLIRPALAVGATGVVGMAQQMAGRLVRAYFDACARGDVAEADRLEPGIFAIYRCFRLGSYYAGIKATMTALGIPVGGPRPPLLPYDRQACAAVEAILQEAEVRALIASVADRSEPG